MVVPMAPPPPLGEHPAGRRLRGPALPALVPAPGFGGGRRRRCRQRDQADRASRRCLPTAAARDHAPARLDGRAVRPLAGW
jgi:hypothetical protein